MRGLLLILLLLGGACGERTPGYALIGDADRGRVLVTQYGCPACHDVPGTEGRGMVGPPLNRIGDQKYLAGRLPNVPQNLVLWIRHPGQLKPGTAMPDLNVGDRDARDIAAYLYTLR